MAGHARCWSFALVLCPDGTFSLRAKRELVDPDQEDNPLVVEPIDGIAGGAALYEVIRNMLTKPCIDGDTAAPSFGSITSAIAKLDPRLAGQFTEVALADLDAGKELISDGIGIHSCPRSKAEAPEPHRSMDAPKVVTFSGERTDYMRGYIEGLKRRDAERRKQAKGEGNA